MYLHTKYCFLEQFVYTKNKDIRIRRNTIKSHTNRLKFTIQQVTPNHGLTCQMRRMDSIGSSADPVWVHPKSFFFFNSIKMTESYRQQQVGKQRRGLTK